MRALPVGPSSLVLPQVRGDDGVDHEQGEDCPDNYDCGVAESGHCGLPRLLRFSDKRDEEQKEEGYPRGQDSHTNLQSSQRHYPPIRVTLR